jgi:hypothetical protein
MAKVGLETSEVFPLIPSENITSAIPSGAESGAVASTTLNLLTLIAQLAALPPEQRAMLAKLLTSSPVPPLAESKGLDDRLPPGFERTGG